MNVFPNPDGQWKPGQSGNPKGVPKGTKHISTWIQDLLNDETFEAMVLDSKVGVKEYQGAPLKAIIGVAIARSINGEAKWAEWLAKHGYGTFSAVDHTTKGKELPTPILGGTSNNE